MHVYIVMALLFGQEQDKPPQEEFPRWTVHGVLATDVSAVHADKFNRNPVPEEGIVGEYALGATMYASRGLSVTVRACYGCHSLEVQSAFADVELTEAVTFRVGRLPVPFGAFSQRTSPAHLESSTKPLPYIMGGMVRQRSFNMGLVPAPIVDNGASIRSNVWMGESAQLGAEAAVVAGLKGFSPDINFVTSRDFEDNNGEPAGAARVTLSLGPAVLGASAMYGRYDPDGDLDYGLAGADLHLRFGSWNLRLEGALRNTEFFAAGGGKEQSRRIGYAAQLDTALDEQWRLFALHDYLRVEDVFLAPFGPQVSAGANTTDDVNAVTRFAGGGVYAARPGLLIKGSAEFWNLSDFEDAWVFHLSVVVEY
ncbi:MAG: hypothetical protein HY716_05355 [Planctomycetes bacterium]|nr:hypothetical protein [Planctomycetota bacterium]